MHILHRDYETRSTAELPDTGAWRYAADPTTDVWCAAYSVGDGPIKVWLPGEPVPEEFHKAATEPDWIVVAHNDAFERAIEEHILAPRYGWPLVPLDRHRCTMAMCSAAALPAGLAAVAEVLELKNQKDSAGSKLMKQMARGEHLGDADKLKQLCAYCVQDVEVERELFHKLPPLTDSEQALWVLDATINGRGFPTDGPLLEAASRIAAESGASTQTELAEITGGALTSTNQVAAIQAWLAERGCVVKDVQKGTLKAALRRKDLDPVVRRVMELRIGAAHAAAAKIDSLLAYRDADGRIRGTLRFHGAGTGRWTGSGPQPQNFKRDTDGVEAKRTAVATGDLAHVSKLFSSPLEVVGDLARSMISAESGKRFLIGDFSGIESRVLAWVSGQQSKIDQWAKFDRTGDPSDEPYFIIGRGCGRPVETARSIGKTADLAFGYMGSIGAWDKLAPDDDTSTEADKERYKKSWRNQHRLTTQFWARIDRACIQAVRKPGVEFPCRKLKVIYDGERFLRITLPSGRALSYPFPRVEVGKYEGDMVVFKDATAGKFTDCRYGNGAYGGLWTENIVQAISRDLLAASMHRLEAAGYPVILHVHDEIVCEAPTEHGSLEEFTALITALPDWAEGLPIAAKVRNGQRFAKSEQTSPPAPPPAPLAEPKPWEGDNEIPESEPEAEREPDTGDKLSNIPFVVIPGFTLAALKSTAEPKVAVDVTPEETVNGVVVATTIDPERGPYIYRDQRGSPHAKVVRTPGGKSRFTQMHWTGKVWSAGMPNRKLPYRLPELLAADPSDWVCICEGEKDAVNVAKLGMTATTNPNGAKGWSKANLVGWFTLFSKIVIFEDNDEPGRERTKRIVQTLRVISPAPEIRVVSFPELPEGGDVSDWLALGNGRTELLARLEAIDPIGAGKLDSLRASTVTMESYDWLWPDRFALGEIGLVVGMPDEGKGQLLAYIAGRVTNGLSWPNDEGQSPQGNVILLTAEDDVKKTVVPRLTAAGADLDRVEIVKMMHEHDPKGGPATRMFSLISDLEQLRAKITSIGSVKLILIDPISAYLGLGKVDSYRTSDVRAILGPLKDLAEEIGVAVIGIMHFNKKIDVTNVLLRVSDSLAFVAAPRHVFSVIDDADNARKLVVRAKNNLAAADQKNKALAFHFDTKEVGVDARSSTPIRAPYIVWEDGYVDVTATEALSAASENRAPGAGDEAKNFLAALLANGPVAAKEVEEAAECSGISERTLRRAKSKLKVVVQKSPTPNGGWFWTLPSE